MRQKKIVFICPDFFSYHKLIIRALESQGWDVTYLSDRPSGHPIVKILIRKCKFLLTPFLTWFYKKKIRKTLSKEKYDQVLIVKGEGITVEIINLLRDYTDGKVVLYFWDNIKNVPGGVANAKAADVVYSFDPSDVQRYKFNLLPLFYVKKEQLPNQVSEWKASFVGSIHSDRMKVLSKVKTLLSQNVFIFIYFPSLFHYYFRLLFDRSFKSFSESEISLIPLSRDETDDVFSRSIAVLDIQYPEQFGLSMRTMEVLSLGKKLITTNGGITQYPFYSSKQILIINRESMHIPESFFEQPNDPEIVEKLKTYEINNWVKALTCETH